MLVAMVWMVLRAMGKVIGGVCSRVAQTPVLDLLGVSFCCSVVWLVAEVSEGSVGEVKWWMWLLVWFVGCMLLVAGLFWIWYLGVYWREEEMQSELANEVERVRAGNGADVAVGDRVLVYASCEAGLLVGKGDVVWEGVWECVEGEVVKKWSDLEGLWVTVRGKEDGVLTVSR